MNTYKIIRFEFGIEGPKEIIEEGLTLEEAQQHCLSPDTKGDGWFDGYTKED